MLVRFLLAVFEGKRLVAVPIAAYLVSSIWFRFWTDFGGDCALFSSGLLVLGCAAAMQVMAFKKLQSRQLETPWKSMIQCIALSLLVWPVIELLLVIVVLNVLGPISGAEGGMQMAGAFAFALLWAIPLATLLASYAGLWLARRLRIRG